MNLSLNAAAESLIRQMISSGRFETPEGVVEAALFQAFAGKESAPKASERLMDPPLAFDEAIVIELPRRPGVPVTAAPAATQRAPDPVVLEPGCE